MTSLQLVASHLKSRSSVDSNSALQSKDSPYHDWYTGRCSQHVPHLTFLDPLLCWRIDLCFYPFAVPENELQLAVQLAQIRRMVWWSAKESSAAASLCGGTKTEEGLVAEELG